VNYILDDLDKLVKNNIIRKKEEEIKCIDTGMEPTMEPTFTVTL
jgi:hypothetical protein